MTTDTKEAPEKEKTEEKKMVTIVIGGREIEVEADNKLVAQLDNLVETQREEEFSEARGKVGQACKKVIDTQTKGFEDQLEGMGLVFDFDSGAVKIIPYNRIKLMERGPRVIKTGSGDK